MGRARIQSRDGNTVDGVVRGEDRVTSLTGTYASQLPVFIHGCTYLE